MLIDEVYANIKAGDGGNGMVHFFSDRWRPKGGPDGGNGGDGGTVYFQAVADIGLLKQFKSPKIFSAQNGQNGGRNQRTGHNGEDLVIRLPVGTKINYDNGTSVELTTIGQKVVAAKGGRGGRGNFSFRSSTNQTPKESTPGEKKPVRRLFLQLKLIAQIGLIGLPNSGKTSLLNALTSAKAKVANYPFTTLEPNLGALPDGSIIADIPGLIEGASVGRGLGFRFLKHIERTSILVHCLSSESKDPISDYRLIRTELSNYSQNLINKPEILLITKSDLIEKPKALEKLKKAIHARAAVSIIDEKSLNFLRSLLTQTLTGKTTATGQ